ncbi:MAG: NAD(P)-binding protein [Sphingomonadales bacterium]|nr:NAD(P)-binding protein [Sphingomonadales bacterium]
MTSNPSSSAIGRSAGPREVAIIGAGLAGLACAEALVAAGYRVALFDKARGPGGRMSTRRVATPLGEASFDHGAQYFTARDPGFQAVVAGWAQAGLADRWPAAGAEAWVGVPGMNAPVRHMAAAHDVRWSTRIDALTRTAGGWQLEGDGLPGGPVFPTVVVALPAEQAAILLEPWDAAMAAQAAATTSAPCWTVMLALAAPLPTATVTLRDRGAIGWAARNSAKPGRTGPETWVIQASPDWSRAQLEAEPARVVQSLAAGLSEALGAAIPEPVHATAHRWRYARSGALGGGFLHNGAQGLGACGDWLIGPRVEAAWLSGTLLGQHLAAGA